MKDGLEHCSTAYRGPLDLEGMTVGTVAAA